MDEELDDPSFEPDDDHGTKKKQDLSHRQW